MQCIYCTLILNQVSIISYSSEFVCEAIFYCLFASKHASELMVFCQITVESKVFCDQINSGTADPREWLGPGPAVKQWSVSSTAREFKVLFLGDVLIRAYLEVSTIPCTVLSAEHSLMKTEAPTRTVAPRMSQLPLPHGRWLPAHQRFDLH